MMHLLIKLPFIKNQLPVGLHDFGWTSEKEERQIIRSFKQILRTNSLGLHFKVVSDFEKKFAKYHRTEFALGLASGTDAIYQSLKAIGAGPGKEVITVANTWITTITAIEETGASCRFVDIDCATGMMNIDHLKTIINDNTLAILPVHMYGLMQPMAEILALAEAAGIAVIEDACQAIGSKYDGALAGTLGDIGCFSFHATKLVGAPGDGGMIVSNNESLYQSIKASREASWDSEDLQFRVPNRLSPLQVPFLDAKLNRLVDNIERRRGQYQLYVDALKSEKSWVLSPVDKVIPSYRNCILLTDKKQEVIDALSKIQVTAESIYASSPVLVERLKQKQIDLPQSYYFINNHLSLPLGMHLTPAKQKKIIDIVASIIND